MTVSAKLSPFHLGIRGQEPTYALQRQPGTSYVSTNHRGPAPLNTALGRMRTAIFLTVLAFTSSSIAEELETYMEFDKHGPRAETPEICGQLGGSWRVVGILVGEMCLVPTADGGKPCRDSGECESTCLAPKDTSYHQRTTGRCHGSYSTLGMCVARVHIGRAGAEICSD